MSETKLVQMNIPVDLLKEVEKYQKEQYHQTRTAAVIDLILKGLKVND